MAIKKALMKTRIGNAVMITARKQFDRRYPKVTPAIRTNIADAKRLVAIRAQAKQKH